MQRGDGKLSTHVECDSCDKDSEIDLGLAGELHHPGSRAVTAPWLSAVIAERWEVSLPWRPGPCHFNFTACVPGHDFQVNFMLGFLVWVISDLWRSPVCRCSLWAPPSPALPWKVSVAAAVLPGHLPPRLGACPQRIRPLRLPTQGRQPQGYAGGERCGSSQTG